MKSILVGLMLPFILLFVLVGLPSPLNWILAAVLFFGFLGEQGTKGLLVGILAAIGVTAFLGGDEDV